ncbi:VOC family protein [Niallia circulans]
MFKVGSIFIPVTDMKKSTDWYVKFLGVKIIDSWEDGAGFYLPAGTTQLALVKVESPSLLNLLLKGSRRTPILILSLMILKLLINNLETMASLLQKSMILAE